MLDLLGLGEVGVYQGHSLLLPTDPLVLFYADYALAWIGLRDGPWKFLEELGSGRARLFNLSTDPGESIDLSRQFPERVTAYHRHASQWSAAQKANILNWRIPSS